MHSPKPRREISNYIWIPKNKNIFPLIKQVVKTKGRRIILCVFPERPNNCLKFELYWPRGGKITLCSSLLKISEHSSVGRDLHFLSNSQGRIRKWDGEELMKEFTCSPGRSYNSKRSQDVAHLCVMFVGPKTARKDLWF